MHVPYIVMSQINLILLKIESYKKVISIAGYAGEKYELSFLHKFCLVTSCVYDFGFGKCCNILLHDSQVTVKAH